MVSLYLFLLFLNVLDVFNSVSALKRNTGIFQFDENKIKFHLWNKNTIEQPIHLNDYGNITVAPTNILIHGWMDGGTGAGFFYYGPVVQKYVKTGANVICVDWSYYSHKEFVKSVSQLRALADLIAQIILGLKEKSRISLSNIHVIGHSLGAQVAGFVGKCIQEKTNGQKINRVTGLDPAGPGFRDRPPTDRLYKTDATRVDTVISDKIQFGNQQPPGQVNFIVNCAGIVGLGVFNHNFAPFYYEYGILKDDLIGKQCQCRLHKMESCKEQPTNILGEHTDFKKSGNFYLSIDIREMMKDARKAMQTAPKSRFDIDFLNMYKTIFNLLYVIDSKGEKL